MSVYRAILSIKKRKVGLAQEFINLLIPFNVTSCMRANGDVCHQVVFFGPYQYGILALIGKS
jgi:hypothetical protein